MTIMSVSSAPLEHTFPNDYEKVSEENCCVSVFHFWYVNQIYKEEIKHIERKNGVKTTAHVNVTFKADREDGRPDTALSEFANLVQSDLTGVSGSVIPLKFVDPDQWSDALKVVQKSKNKLLLLLSSEEVTVCGPSHSQEAFSATLNAMQKTTASFKECKAAPQNQGKVDMNTSYEGPEGNVSFRPQASTAALLYLSLKWSESDQEKRKKYNLEKTLQGWLNKNTNKLICSVLRILEDGSAEIEITPAPGAV